jgi:spermidine synthase
VLGTVVAGPAALAQWAADAPLNTDDHPVVAYRAPRITYAPDSLPRDRLFSLLQALHLSPDELMQGPQPEAWTQRLVAYGAARNQYLAHGRTVQPQRDVQAMLAQVQGPLLQVLRTSPDFTPAYEPLLQMAQALAADQPTQARALLQALVRTVPARGEAALALQDLPP